MFRLSLCLLAAFFVSCSTQDSLSPVYIDCNTWPNWSDDANVKCGYILVPEDHENESGKKIKLAFAIKKGAPESEVPVLYLTGGPGQAALDDQDRFNRDDLTAIGDVILVDQRGMGRSSALPNIGDAMVDIFARDLSEEQEKQAVKECMALWKSKIAAEEIELAMYNSYQNARDFGLLMEALGYSKYNLWAGSYGTRLAAVMMKYFPEDIHAAALTSPAPLDNRAMVSRIPDFDASLEALFQECAEDPQCMDEHGDFKLRTMEALTFLHDNPMEVQLAGRNFIINPQDAVFLIRYLLYRSNAKKLVSDFVKGVMNGDTEVIEQLAANAFTTFNGVNISSFYAFSAYEEYDESTAQEVMAELDSSDVMSMAGLAWFQSFIPELGNWHGARITDEEKRFDTIEVPTLIVANTFDPTTPPRHALLFQEVMKNSQIVNLGRFGHGAQGSCISRIRREFLRNPFEEIDMDCLQQGN